MTLNEIIDTVKHDAEYFADPQTDVQAGRAFEANKILTMLYLLQKEQSNKLLIMRPASASAVGSELLPVEGSAKGVSVCKLMENTQKEFKNAEGRECIWNCQGETCLSHDAQYNKSNCKNIIFKLSVEEMLMK